MNISKTRSDKYSISLSSRDIDRIISDHIQPLLPEGVKVPSGGSMAWSWSGLNPERGGPKFGLEIVFEHNGKPEEISSVCECGEPAPLDGVWHKCVSCGKHF